MRVAYRDGLSLKIFIMDLLEALKPDSAEKLQTLSQDIHEHIEIAIQDHCENLPFWNEYEPMI